VLGFNNLGFRDQGSGGLWAKEILGSRDKGSGLGINVLGVKGLKKGQGFEGVWNPGV